MKTWFSDTLAKRLLLLMWVALVGSHLIAFAAVHSLHLPPAGPGPRGALPTFPSLPPTPGLPDERARPPVPPGGLAGREPAPPMGGAGPPPPRDAGGGLPWDALLLDYGIRFVVIALAAWFGSRWLAAPMRRLVDASTALGGSLAADAPLPVLDEARGTREVREAARVFNDMARQLREQFRARGLLLAAISHDLRTPLTRLRMRLETAEAPPELRQRSVDDINEMDILIGETLELFRLEGGAAGAEALQAVDVSALVQAIADDYAEQGLVVAMQGDAAVVAMVRPFGLKRVVGNLIGNALRYGSRAEVIVARVDTNVSITVDDDGPGIPPAQLETVFRPFYRLETSRSRATGGTGLGLYIARDLTHRMGGALTLVNRPEGGLRALILLPLN